MTSLNGIAGATRVLAGSGVGSTSTVPAPTAPGRAFDPMVQKHFGTTFGSAVGWAMDGEFDDRDLTAREQKIRDRLLSHTRRGPGAIGQPPPANANPGSAGATGAQAGPDAIGAEVLADQRELHEVGVQSALARARNVRATLGSRLPDAARLPSITSGQLDAATFEPGNEGEARAFAERLTLDLTTAAADLEVVAARLRKARFDKEHAATAEGRAAAGGDVAALDAEHKRLADFVLDLGKVVDERLGGSLSEAGAATAGRGQLSAAIGEGMRDGLSREDLERLKGLGAALAQENTTGSSELLNTFKQDLFQTFMRQMHARERAAAKRREREAENQAIERRAENRRAERRADDQRAAEKAAARRAELYQRW